MFERSGPKFDAYFLPGPAGLPTDESVSLGVKWLLSQPGDPLIVLARRGNVSNNRILDVAVKEYRIKYTAPPRVYEHHWTGGSILVP